MYFSCVCTMIFGAMTRDLPIERAEEVPEGIKALHRATSEFLQKKQIPDSIAKTVPQIATELKDDKMIGQFKSRIPARSKSDDGWYFGGGWFYDEKAGRITLSFSREDNAVLIHIRVESKKDGGYALQYLAPTFIRKK